MKRYMDFAPRKANKTTTSGAKSTAEVVMPSGAKSRVTVRRTTGADVRQVAKAGAKPASKSSAPVRSVNKATVTVRKTGATKVAKPNLARAAKKPTKTVGEAVREAELREMAELESQLGMIMPVENPVENFDEAEIETEIIGATDADMKKDKKAKSKVEKSAKTEPAVTKETMAIPHPTFINQNKVEKRPLSKNYYPKKKVEPTKEPTTGPVAIISKPEKDKHVSIIVTIIITIILGAAAGTVAFLLLPK